MDRGCVTFNRVSIMSHMKVIEWLKLSNRWKHLIGGVALGTLALNNYCAMYGAILSASCLEFKDKAYGGKWDWIDWLLTVVGFGVGRGLNVMVGGLL